MMQYPPREIIDHAIQVARLSPCRSKRGVVIWDTSTGRAIGHGFNAPPSLLPCPGRDVCSGSCGQRAVHAEVRAIYATALARVPNLETSRIECDLLHIELAPVELMQPVPSVMVTLGADTVTFGRMESRPSRGPGVIACDGPSCASCAALIADVTFIHGVWLFEHDGRGWAGWRRYLADEFYAASMARCAVSPSVSIGGRHIHE